MDGEPLGRLVLQNGQMYNFDLSSKEEEANDDELLVDLKIDGKHGPIPKIINGEHKKTKVWYDTGDKIDHFETTAQKMKAINTIANHISGSISNPDKVRKEVSALQIGTETSSADDSLLDSTLAQSQ